MRWLKEVVIGVKDASEDFTDLELLSPRIRLVISLPSSLFSLLVISSRAGLALSLASVLKREFFS